MKREVKITVAGACGSGKSRILYLIKKTLKEKGINVSFNGGFDFKNEEEFDERMENNIDLALIQIAEHTSVKLDEVQIQRSLNN